MKIYIEGKYLNQIIVAEGFAWWYKRYAPKDADLKEAENDARALNKGLWSHPRPIPPWKFRRQNASKDGENLRELIQSNVLILHRHHCVAIVYEILRV